MLRWSLRIAVLLATILVVGMVVVRLTYGGGKPYPDISTVPTLSADRISTPIQLPYPPGMVAISPTGRIFYTYHMLHKPERFTDATVFEWQNGQGVPFPNSQMQSEFHGAMGVTTDQQGRLWIIKPGALENQQTRLIAVDIASGAIVLDHEFAKGEAGFAQDMRVSRDGNTVFLADTGLLKFSPASLIIFDVESQTTRTVLEGHPSVSAQDWVIRKTNGKPYKLALGFLTFSVGVDGIALSENSQWLYFAAMSHDSVYRIPTQILLNSSLSDKEIAEEIEFVGRKPMSDGIELLPDNTLILTDVENGGLAALTPDGTLVTLTKDGSIDWADSVSIAPDGSIWFTDSRLTDLIDQYARTASKNTMLERGPYYIYRISPTPSVTELSEPGEPTR